MNANTRLSKAWREEQKRHGRTPKLIWVDEQEWQKVKDLIRKLKLKRTT